MNYCQKEEFLSKQVHRDLEDCYQCFLQCSGEYVFQWYKWDSEEESAQLIQYPNHNYRTGLKNLENYVWICAHVSDVNQVSGDKFDFFGIMTVKETISRWPDKF